jgi:hypothetical protein
LENMKFQIKFLEDERQKMALKCISQACTIEIAQSRPWKRTVNSSKLRSECSKSCFVH